MLSKKTKRIVELVLGVTILGGGILFSLSAKDVKVATIEPPMPRTRIATIIDKA